jgi:predicted nucleic acid-binding protein
MSRLFIDTNVFLYAFLDQNDAKKSVAARIVSNAVLSGNGYVSLQVVNEFCNVIVKKSGKPLSEMLEATRLLERFNIVDGSLRLTGRALEIKDAYGVQFYDSLMLACAEASGCSEILTEDLNDGQMYGSVKAVNPFKGL